MDLRAELTTLPAGPLRAAVEARLRAVERESHVQVIDPTPTVFDFDADMEPPDWLVCGVIERGTASRGRATAANERKGFRHFALCR